MGAGCVDEIVDAGEACYLGGQSQKLPLRACVPKEEPESGLTDLSGLWHLSWFILVGQPACFARAACPS